VLDDGDLSRARDDGSRRNRTRLGKRREKEKETEREREIKGGGRSKKEERRGTIFLSLVTSRPLLRYRGRRRRRRRRDVALSSRLSVLRERGRENVGRSVSSCSASVSFRAALRAQLASIFDSNTLKQYLQPRERERERENARARRVVPRCASRNFISCRKTPNDFSQRGGSRYRQRTLASERDRERERERKRERERERERDTRRGRVNSPCAAPPLTCSRFFNFARASSAAFRPARVRQLSGTRCRTYAKEKKPVWLSVG